MCKVKTKHLLAVNGLLPVAPGIFHKAHFRPFSLLVAAENFHWAHHETVRYPYICK